MVTEFEYGKDTYIYDNQSGWIEKLLYGGKLTEKICPIFQEASTEMTLEHISLTDSEKAYILRAILHGYSYGVDRGKRFKATELRRALGID